MASEAQREIQRIVNEFSEKILQVVKRAVFASLDGNDGKLASPSSVARRGRPRLGRPKATSVKVKPAAVKVRRARAKKSTPEEVDQLGGEILEALQAAGGTMSSSELIRALKVPQGRFHYALGKLKADKKISQEGERRMAKYGLAGGKTRAKAKTAKPAEGEGQSTSETTATE